MNEDIIALSKNKFLCSNCQQLKKEIYSLKSQLEQKESEAVGFAEWMNEEGYNSVYNSNDDNDGKWYDGHAPIESKRDYKTIKQLYTNYQQSLKQITK